MKKLLLSFVYCFLTVSVFGQQATWNGTATSWNYSFAAAAGTLSGSGLNNNSTSGSAGFLPVPSSGSVFLRSGTVVSPVFTIGTTDKLDFRATTATDNTNLSKFGIRGVANTTAITSVNFTINFSHADAEWQLAIGKSSATADLFNTTSSFSASGSTNLRKASFAAFRWGKDGIKNLEFLRQDADGVLLSSHPVIGTYDIGTYKLEFLINNSSGNQYYTKNNVQYTIPTRNHHLWINDVRVEFSADNYNFPANGLAVGDEINSLMIQGKNPNGTGGTSDVLSISGLNFQSVTSTTLPVSLTSFTGKAVSNNVLLNWQTASESNNSHFDILRFSADNQNPVKIGEVTGKDNSNVLVDYNFSDKHPLTGINYYQLRQVDFDGKSSLSAVVPVKVGLNEAHFYVYPSASESYMANFYSESATTGTFTLLDVNGRNLNSLSVQLEKGNNTIVLNNKSLSPGIYLSRVVAGGEEIIRKFIVK